MTIRLARKANMFHFAAVILAAGASLRMGRPKLLLPWTSGSTVIGHLLSVWSEAGARQLAVVCAPNNLPLGQELARPGLPPHHQIVNPEPGRGMFSSIQCAANWQGWEPSVTHWALVLGDQPHVATPTVTALLSHARAHSECICQPGRNQRPRHPVVFPADVWRQLGQAPTHSLKDYLENHASRRSWVEMDDSGLDLDIDTPSDYRRALDLVAKNGNGRSPV